MEASIQSFLNEDWGNFKKEIFRVIGESVRKEFSEFNKENLNSRDNSVFLNLNETAMFFDITPQTLRVWRKEGKLPRPVIRGRRIYYKRKDLEAMK